MKFLIIKELRLLWITVAIAISTALALAAAPVPAVSGEVPADAGRGNAVKDPYADAPELSRRESTNANGQITRVRIVRSRLKCPLLRIEEVITKHPRTGAEVVRSQSVMVADQVIVKSKPKAPRRALDAILRRLGATLSRTLPNSRFHVVKLPNAGVDTVPDAVKTLEAKSGLIDYAEPDFVVRADVIPNDARFSGLWGLHNTGQMGGVADADIDAPEAWDLSVGSASVLVGVIDSGIDYNHPDLAPNLWTNPHEIAGNGIDDDANGYIDDVRGWDFANGDNDPSDDNSHGTHCAGTIGAAGNNALGVTGVCWNVSLVGLKFMDAGGSGLTSDAAEAVLYATRVGAKATSNSWGGGAYLQTLKDAIDGANAAGVLFIAAAGNSGEDNDAVPRYPSCYDSPNVISVAATDRTDTRAWFSNYGTSTVDLAAPGMEILSCYPGGYYSFASGTSMAAPHVAGACALLMACQPGISHLAVKELILGSVDQVPSLAGRVATHGRLNLHRALTSSRPDHFTEIFDDSGNDTAYQTFTFTPDGSPDHYRAQRQPATAFPTHPAGGNPLPMGDEESLPVVLGPGAAVSLYGTSHTSFHVGSNGYLTFGPPDYDHSESLADHFRLPRVSALFDDLNPGEGGMISWKQLPDRVAVTFLTVMDASLDGTNSFQIEMFFDGRIRITLLGLYSTGGLIGLSRGTGVPTDFHESDFTAFDPAPPEILRSPESLTASIGSAAALDAAASGNGTTWYLWRCGGIPIFSARDPILEFSPVRPEHAGVYDVMVFNSRSSATSGSATLTVSAGTIANGSFESDLTAWSTAGNVAVTAGPPNPTDGNRLAIFNAGNSAPNGVLTQRFATLAGLRYFLEFNAGAFSTVTAEARIGIEVSGSSLLRSETLSIAGPGGGGTAWLSKRYEFTADSNVTTLVFRDLSPGTSGVDLVLDHLRLGPALGSDHLVTTLEDEDDGLLGQGGGDSLREAISVARWIPGANSIRFAPSLNGGTVNLADHGQLTVYSDMTIDASDLSRGVTISGNDNSRIFEITPGSTVSITKLLMTNGECVGGSGGGILNSGNLSVTDSVIARCWRMPVTSDWGDGGGIHNQGTLDLLRTAVFDNHVNFGHGAGVGNSGTLRMVNCTVSGNIAVEGGGGVANSGVMSILQSTISNNEALYEGGGGLLNTGSLTLVNSIVAGNLTYVTNPNLSGPLEPGSGGNLLDGDPRLAPLADYGGTTPAMPPLPGSPAIEGADPAQPGIPATDQLGHARPAGPRPDIGAVEAFPFSTLPLIDSDGDRIDDRLESSYHLTVGVDDSAADSDGDGFKDADELADMTDPLDANSRLMITALERCPDHDPVSNPSYNVHFTSFPGLSYSLECDPNLDFTSTASRRFPCGTAQGFSMSTHVVLLPGRDFVRVRRDP